jgi:hypothetical protein
VHLKLGIRVSGIYTSDVLAIAPHRLHARRIIGAFSASVMAMIGAAAFAAPAGAQPGYWLGADDGGVFSFNVPFYGSTVQGTGLFSASGDSLCAQGCTITSQANSAGYWQLATAALDPVHFSDAVPEGLVIQGFGLSRSIDDLSQVPTPISPIRPWRIASVGASAGVWIANAYGAVYSANRAPDYGSMAGRSFDGSIVGIASTPDGMGFWLAASDGGVFTFGDAPFYGSMGATHLDAPAVGIAPTKDGQGYWLVASDGGIFAFGDAAYLGSMGGRQLNAPMVAIAANPDGIGYWTVASDGGVFAFGDAPFFGSMAGTRLNAPVTAIATTS